ncbi:hypothetical protein, partial [Pseudophaeobacter sp.]|uniref:hypothetical protein n=1 Tax=Pseudophaeobacter sp. TaxID=1971739 RepID=UPI0040591BE4
AASAHHCKPTSSWFCTLWGANCSCLPAIMLDSCSESLQGFVQQSRVDVQYLTDLLSRKRVKYGNVGTEHYRKNGDYRYSAGGSNYDAGSYRFYPNGVRCIGYSNPRFDLYVVNGGKLFLINREGARLEGKVR